MNKYINIMLNYNYFRTLDQIMDKSKNRELVFLCVGNPKVWYDAFGPIFGTLLKYLNIENFIYGDLKCPITPMNIEYYIDCIYKFHQNPYVVVFDSAISRETESIIKIKEEGIECACMSDQRITVGDASIIYTVNDGLLNKNNRFTDMFSKIKELGRMLHFVLQQHKYKNAKKYIKCMNYVV